jgi:hypothetical protein
MRRHDPVIHAWPSSERRFIWRLRKCRSRRHLKSRQHLPLRQLLIRHQTATLCRGWRL